MLAGFSLTLALAAGSTDLPTLSEFEAVLSAQDSATQALGQWCAARQIADPPVIRALNQASAKSNDPPANLRRILGLSAHDTLAMRHVHLVCGDKVLSIAWNWYVPSRLTPEMNAALNASDAPFGKVAGPLRFRREPLEIIAGPADNCPPTTISTHRALLRLPDGQPLALVVECYTPANLAQ